jgi:putative sterol carrier protein
MPLPFVQFDQVAQLTVRLGSGKTRVGSGFLLAERLVLTAAHVVRGDLADQIHVSLPFVAASATGSIMWSGSAVGLDAALIELDRPPATARPTLPPSVRWGWLTGQQPGVPATAVGFPRVLRADDGQRPPDHLNGRINPGVAMGQRYDLNLDGVPPRSTEARRSAWSGLSGAALYSANLLIGVMVIDTPNFQSGRLTAVPAWRLLADEDFAARLRRHGCSTEVESVELSGLFERPPGFLESPASMLRADQAIVRFRGREEELDKLQRWCANEQPLAVALVTGPGGQGKTRLARELCLQMRKNGWLAGFADNTERATGAAERLADSRLPVLLAVDYAETRPGPLRRLIEATELPSNRVRLLLLARSARDWWDRVRQQHASVPAMKQALPVLDDSATGRAGAYRQALEDFATHLALISSGTFPWPEIARAPSIAYAQLPTAASVLQVHTTALIALLQAGPHAVSTEPSDGVEEVLLKHEQEYWRKTAEARHVDYQPETLRNAVAAASLCGATQQREALATLTRVPGLQDQPEDRRLGVASWLHDLYPTTEDQYWGSLQPDRLAEHLVGAIARLDPDFIVQLLAGATDAQKYRAFRVLDRAADHQPHLVDVWPPLERISRVHGDNPSFDAAVRQLLMQPESMVFALGMPAPGGAVDTAYLLHCTVPVGEETIPMLPVFTRLENVVSAVVMNPAWQSLQVVQMQSHAVLGDLEEEEWLGINPWSGREFKLPPASPGDTGGNEEEVAEHSEVERADLVNAAHQDLSRALGELSRLAGTFGNTPDERRRYEEAVAEHSEVQRADLVNAAARNSLDSGRDRRTTGPTPNDVFSEIDERLKADPEKLTGTIAKYLFNLSGDDAGEYHIDIHDGAGDAGPGHVDNPNITITMDSGDFVDLATGELDGTAAYMSGKITLQGDMGLAVQLQNLLQ